MNMADEKYFKLLKLLGQLFLTAECYSIKTSNNVSQITYLYYEEF